MESGVFDTIWKVVSLIATLGAAWVLAALGRKAKRADDREAALVEKLEDLERRTATIERNIMGREEVRELHQEHRTNFEKFERKFDGLAESMRKDQHEIRNSVQTLAVTQAAQTALLNARRHDP